MSYRKDVIPLDEAFPFNLFRTSGTLLSDTRLHFHDCLELDFILSGNGINQIETTSYPVEVGDLYVINNLEHHMAFNNHQLEILVIVFDPALIGGFHTYDDAYLHPFFNRSVRFKNRISPTDNLYHQLKALVFQIEGEWQLKDVGYPLVIKAMLLQLLALLYRHYVSEDALSLSSEQQQFRQSFERIRDAIHYIHEHYTTTISLEALAAISSMNKSYFSTFFKSVMGQTVTGYVDILRLQQARFLLNTSNLSITEVALASGFSNLSFFNRRFKSYYGCVPRDFKKKTSL